MSNSLLQSDPDALRESAIAVITYVRDAMNDGVKLLRDHDQLLIENRSDHRLDAEIRAINENLKTTLNKQYLCQFSPESREDFNGKLSFKRGLAKVVILKNSVKVFRKVFFNVSFVL